MHIKIFDTRNNEYFFSEIYIDEKKRKIVGSDIKGFFNEKGLKTDKDNQPRLFANSATLSDGDVIFEKGIFTTCKIVISPSFCFAIALAIWKNLAEVFLSNI